MSLDVSRSCDVSSLVTSGHSRCPPPGWCSWSSRCWLAWLVCRGSCTPQAWLDSPPPTWGCTPRPGPTWVYSSPAPAPAALETRIIQWEQCKCYLDRWETLGNIGDDLITRGRTSPCPYHFQPHRSSYPGQWCPGSGESADICITIIIIIIIIMIRSHLFPLTVSIWRVSEGSSSMVSLYHLTSGVGWASTRHSSSSLRPRPLLMVSWPRLITGLWRTLRLMLARALEPTPLSAVQVYTPPCSLATLPDNTHMSPHWHRPMLTNGHGRPLNVEVPAALGPGDDWGRVTRGPTLQGQERALPHCVLACTRL